LKWKNKDPYFKAGLTVFLTGAALMCVYRLFHSVEDLWRSIQGGIGTVVSTLTPFIIALVIAYLLRPLRDFLARILGRIFPRVREGRVRTTAITLAVVLFLAALASAIALLIPAIWTNLMDLIAQLPGYFTQAETLLAQLNEIPWIAEMNFVLNMDQLETQLLQWLKTFVADSNWGYMAGQVVATVGGVFSGVITFVLSLVLCVYMLKSGRELMGGIRSVLARQFGEKRAQSLDSLVKEIDTVFGQYIGGKMMQCFIMFAMILAAFVALGVPYAPLMAAIVAVSNLIPYVGPFLGGVVPVFFMLLIDPIKAILVLVAILVVQQIDNYLVEPRLIGDRMGMHPFWVISCVIIGGDLLGIFGILLAIPLAGVLRILAKRYFDRRDAKRRSMEEKSDETGTGN